MIAHYELSRDDGATWSDATEAGFIAAEREAGFFSGRPDEPSTAGFTARPLRGRVTYEPERTP
jgi:hypothetical protein